MRASEVVCLILIIFIVLGGFYYIQQKANYNRDKKTWEDDKRALEQIVEEAQAEVIRETAKAEKALEEADKIAEENSKIKESLRLARLSHRRDLEKIKALAPDQVVSAHWFHLETDSSQIWLNSFGVQFTIEAARTNLTKLEDYQFRIKKEIPSYVEMLKNRDLEVKKLRISINGFVNTTNAYAREVKALKEQVKGETALRLKAEKLIGFKFWSLEGVGLFALGIILGGVAVAVF